MSGGHNPYPIGPDISDDDDEEQGFQILVRNLDGKIKPIDVFRTTTVQELKRKVQKAFGIPPSQQRLVFSGSNLSNDNDTLECYHISKGSTVELMGRLRGG